MTHTLGTPKSPSPPQPRAQRSATAVVAQYIHELAAGAKTSPALSRPTALGQCFGCA